MSAKLSALQTAFYEAYHKNSRISGFTQWLCPSKTLAANERFHVYKNSSQLAMIDSLQAIFNVTYRLVGEDFFSEMVRQYCDKTPSRSPDRSEYGRLFPRFIAKYRYARALPYLADVAHLEWYYHEALHGPDASQLDFSYLASLIESNEAKIRFHLPENSHLFSSTYPILQIWKNNQATATTDKKVTLDQGGEQVIVWRQALNTMIEPLTKAEASVLDSINRGLSIEALCSRFLREQENLDIVSVLQHCTERGWLAKVTLESKDAS